jgi:iron complex transport system substrate-binding protein
MRIVSLIASSTEMVCALDRGDALVGRSHECDHPAWVRALPAVTSPKFALDGSSYDIDQRIRAILQEGLSVYHVDAAALDALAPDVILTQEQCVVCAVSTADVEAAVAALVGSRPRVVALAPDTLGDIWADIERVAAALEVPERGRALVESLRGRVAAIAGQAAQPSRPRVAFIEWIDPLLAAGHWMPELIRCAGGTSVFGADGEPGPAISWDDLAAARPDVVVVAPCGFDLARTRAEMPRRDWGSLGARVVVADGNAYFNRPGPRIVESLEILAEIMHPARVDFGRGRAGWDTYDRDKLAP